MGLQVVYFVLSLYGWYEWLYGGEGRTTLTCRARTPRTGPCSSVDRRRVLGRARHAHVAPARRRAAVSRRRHGDDESRRAVHDDAQAARELDRSGSSSTSSTSACSSSSGLYLTAGNYAIYLVLAVMGYVAWKRSLADSTAAPTRVIRVVLTGSESTGKTTLAEQLARHYRAELVPEFVRELRRGARRRRSSSAITARSRAGRWRSRTSTSRAADRLLVQDTDLLSTVVYCQHYFGALPGRGSRRRRASAARSLSALRDRRAVGRRRRARPRAHARRDAAIVSRRRARVRRVERSRCTAIATQRFSAATLRRSTSSSLRAGAVTRS